MSRTEPGTQNSVAGKVSPASIGDALRGAAREPFNWLLLAMPVAVGLELFHAGPLWKFLVSGLAVIPLAGLMGRATENLAETLGAGIGGLLNATFGNAAELIIALLILSHGPEMYPLVKATITGSIIGNALLVLGMAILFGGLSHSRQEFNRTAASMGATLLALASVGLIMPTVYYYLFRAGTESQPCGVAQRRVPERGNRRRPRRYLPAQPGFFAADPPASIRRRREESEDGEHRQAEWSRTTSLIMLLGATAGVAGMAHILVGSVELAGRALGMNQVFVGVIVVAIVGNAAEHSTAVLMAMKNKMDLALHIAVGSSIQIALFVAPVLVFASMFMGHSRPLDLHFTPLELIALVISVAVLALVSQDGESHWMEGAMLLAVYFILALSFYHLPEGFRLKDRS